MAPTTDPTTPTDNPGHRTGPAPVAQWLGVGLAPAAFLVHLQAGYLLVLLDCGWDGGALLVHASAAMAVLVALAGAFAAWVTWTKSGREMPGDTPGALGRTRLFGIVGLALSGILTLILLAQFVAGFIVPRCQ